MPRLKHITWPAVSPGPPPALLLIGMVLASHEEPLAPIGKYASTSKTDWRSAT